MTQITEPLTPPDCDLQDFSFMPLDVARLRDSELAARETPESCWAAVLLWAASWHQVPAASIPDDEMWIAKVAGYQLRGRIDKAWAGVRQGALRGWVKCSDGRLYHPVVAEKAREAWRSKMEQRWRTECARIKKHNDRHPGANVQRPTFEEWAASGCPTGHALPVPRDNGECPHIVPSETPSKGQGQGQGYISPSLRSGEGAAKPQRPPGRKRSEARTLATYLAECRAAKVKPVPDDHAVRRWAADAGLTPDMLQIAWLQFRDRYTEGEKGKGKRYRDWPAHFATAVKDNWFRLWFTDDKGGMCWSSNGMTHKAVLDARAAQQEVEHEPA